MKFLRLKLKAPLQSWGERSRWDQRDTAAVPTKSGIIGLLGCCMGIPRSDERLKELDVKLHFAVRTDHSGRIMTDFHTVQTEKDNFPNAAGDKRTGNTIITPKQYLQDAEFTIWLWGDEDMLVKCKEALEAPHWTPYLGRKNCVPSLPLVPSIMEASSIDNAVKADLQRTSEVQIEMQQGDALMDQERLIYRPDKVIDASKNEYSYRAIRAYTVRMEE